MNFQEQSLSIDISLHIGSFLAVITYFIKDILHFIQNKNFFFKIMMSSVPVMIVGYVLIKLNLIDQFRNIKVIGWTTIIFGILLYISDKNEISNKMQNNFTYKSALLIGIFQILSLIPGVSRSGIAISAARILKFNRVDSAKISFLLSIPILGAVTIFGLNNLVLSDDINFSSLNILSIFFSFLFSYITIKFFLQYMKKFDLKIFVFYRIILGSILLFFAYL